MNICHNCLKMSDYGHLVSHAKNRVGHVRKPNLHRAHILVDGVKRNVMLCTTCVRSFRKAAQPKKSN